MTDRRDRTPAHVSHVSHATCPVGHVSRETRPPRTHLTISTSHTRQCRQINSPVDTREQRETPTHDRTADTQTRHYRQRRTDVSGPQSRGSLRDDIDKRAKRGPPRQTGYAAMQLCSKQYAPRAEHAEIPCEHAGQWNRGHALQRDRGDRRRAMETGAHRKRFGRGEPTRALNETMTCSSASMRRRRARRASAPLAACSGRQASMTPSHESLALVIGPST